MFFLLSKILFRKQEFSPREENRDDIVGVEAIQNPIRIENPILILEEKQPENFIPYTRNEAYEEQKYSGIIQSPRSILRNSEDNPIVAPRQYSPVEKAIVDPTHNFEYGTPLKSIVMKNKFSENQEEGTSPPHISEEAFITGKNCFITFQFVLSSILYEY